MFKTFGILDFFLLIKTWIYIKGYINVISKDMYNVANIYFK